MLGTTNIDYKALLYKLRGRYFVQWVTEWDENNHITKVLGFCVRDKKDFNQKTVFRHENPEVCEKICQMLNEEEEHNNVRRA